MICSKINHMLFAANHYQFKNVCTVNSFKEDLNILNTIKTHFTKYSKTNNMRYDLLLNHFVVFENCFGDGFIPLLFCMIDHYSKFIKSVILFTDANIDGLKYKDNDNNIVEISSIEHDEILLKRLLIHARKCYRPS